MIEVVVNIGQDVQVILRTDLPYAPDPAADCCTRAMQTALDAYRDLPDRAEQP